MQDPLTAPSSRTTCCLMLVLVLVQMRVPLFAFTWVLA
jgi:hypothetical protein